MRLSDLAPSIGRQRGPIVVVTLVVLFLSTQMFIQPGLLDFWTPVELAMAWFEYVVELAAIAAAMGLGCALADLACRRLGAPRWLHFAGVALALHAAALAGVVLIAMLHNSRALMPDFSLALASALRWTIIGLYLVVMRVLWHRVRETDARGLAADDQADVLARERQALRLQLLNAQIEPHFLFNTLANVRRLYSTDFGRGEQMMASLKRYLRAALPGVRDDAATLADELVLVRAYLELITVRMGSRVSFDVRDDSGLGGRPFPSMVALTLVENAIKHGIEPSTDGGHIAVRATRTAVGLELCIADNGVGLSQAQSGGTGIGLANIRAQLQSRYGATARLEIRGRERGVAATIAIDGAATR